MASCDADLVSSSAPPQARLRHFGEPTPLRFAVPGRCGRGSAAGKFLTDIVSDYAFMILASDKGPMADSTWSLLLLAWQDLCD